MDLTSNEVIEIVKELNNDLFDFEPECLDYWHGLVLITDGYNFYIRYMDYELWDSDNYGFDCEEGDEKIWLRVHIIQEIGKIVNDIKKVNIIEVDDKE